MLTLKSCESPTSHTCPSCSRRVPLPIGPRSSLDQAKRTFQVIFLLAREHLLGLFYVNFQFNQCLTFYVNWKDHFEYGQGNFWPKSGFYVFQDQLNQKYGLLRITEKNREQRKLVSCLIFIFPGPWKRETCLKMKYIPIKFPKKVLFIGAIYFIGLLLRFTSHSPA